MQIVLSAVTIINPGSDLHLKQKDIAIADGVISSIEESGTFNNSDYRKYDCSGLMVSIGWVDLNSHFNDPGYEHKEDIESGIATASMSGFTDVMILPNTEPCIDSKNQVEYVLSKSKGSVTSVYPYAAITRLCKGEELTEMIDLDNAGAIAFTDGLNPIENTDILLKTLQYLQKFDGLLINRPEDRQLNMFGTMHEGSVSTTLGLKGMPSLAEDIMVQRDLKILKYTGGKIHFSNISSAESLKLIKQAKRDGLNVTCDVGLLHLLLDHEMMSPYDSNFKLNPPLRLKEDREALVNALQDGTIDAIVTAHHPQDLESKQLEFDLAEFGAIGLQTACPLLIELSNSISLDLLIQKVTTEPRKLLGLTIPTIEVGSSASLTLFDPKEEWVFDETSNTSKSINSPYFGKKMTGKTKGVVNNGLMEIESLA